MITKLNKEQLETSKRDYKKIVSIIDNNSETLAYLRMRWQDEKEYENFDDYKDKIIEIFKPFKVIKVTKRIEIFIHLIAVNDNKKQVKIRLNLTGLTYKVIQA